MTSSAGGASPAGTYTCGFSSAGIGRPYRDDREEPLQSPRCPNRLSRPAARTRSSPTARSGSTTGTGSAATTAATPRCSTCSPPRTSTSPTRSSHTDELQSTLFKEMKARIKETDLSVPFRKGGRWFYSRTEEGQQYPILCRTDVAAARRPAGGRRPLPGEQVLLDQNVAAPATATTSPLGAFDLAPARTSSLYSTDHDGSERYTMRVRDLRTGDRPARRDPRRPLRHGVGGRLDLLLRAARRGHAPAPGVAPRARHARRRRRAGVRGARRALLRHVGLSLTEEWVHIASGSKVTSEEHLIPAADPTGAPRVIQPARAGRRVRRHPRAHADEDRFVIVTNADGAVNFKLVDAPVDDPGREHWRGARPPPSRREARGRSTCSPATSCATSAARASAGSSSRRYGDGAEHELDHARGGVRHRPRHQRRVRHRHAPLHLHVDGHAVTVFDYDLDTGSARSSRPPRCSAATTPRDYVTGRLWATAPDGARVPISLVHRADVARDGPRPCLLYGYGSYEASIDPGFSIAPPVAARPRLRVRHRPHPRRRRDGPALVRRRQAPPQAQHVHRLHRRAPSTSSPRAARPPTGSSHAAARPAAC